MQDMEFTVEHGKLYMLQTRNGKRTARRRPEDRLRPGGRGHDLREAGRGHDRAPQLWTPCCIPSLTPSRSEEAAAACRQGSARLSRRRLRQDRLHRRGRQGMGCPGREGGSGPSGDLSRGYRGHEGRSGHPDRPRRHDLSRRRCGPRHGQVLRLRLRRHRHGRGEQAVHPGRQDLSTRATG